MKINMPITNIEHTLAETDSIVTKTDLNGIITYANEDFIEISGFTKEELIGAPHNIMRHPDMPTEIFEDLWKSLKAGRPWTGIVKNRIKNGDFCWVLANVTPFYENDTLIGYMSVCSKPSQKQVAEAADFYSKLREGKAGHLKMQGDKVVKKTLLGLFSSLEAISIKVRLSILIIFTSMLLLVIGAMGLIGMKKDSEGLLTVLRDYVVPFNHVSEIQKLMQLNDVYMTTSLLAPVDEVILKNTYEIEKNIAVINRIFDDYATRSFSQNRKNQLDKFKDDKNRFVTESLQPTISALRSNDIALAHKLIKDKLTPLYLLMNEDAQQLLQAQIDETQEMLLASQLRFYDVREAISILGVVGILLILWLSISLHHSLVRPLNATIRHFAQIAQGNYKNIIKIRRMHEVSKVMAGLKFMQIKLGFDVAEAKRIADENLQIKIALDNVSTGVILTDNDRNIIYANKSVISMFEQVETGIGELLPNFSIANLIGSNLDTFHKAFSYEELNVNPTTGSSIVSVDLVDRSMEVTASQVISAEGKTIGSVSEWQDRTAETLVEKEVAVILVGAVMGDFSKRITMQGKLGFFHELSEAINQLMETTESGLNEAAQVFNVLSHGDLSIKITNYYSGTLGELKEDANSMVDDLNNIIGQIKDVAESIRIAAQEITAGNSSLSHRTEQQAASLEQTAASMQQLTSIVQQNSANAKHASELAVSASNTAGKGVAVIGQVIKMMDGINESSRKIAEIVSVIDSIAFQTNILALNAAVEAARAGKEGRGFAVVAGEVRSLAQRAASAAGEIKSLIRDSVEKVEDGSKLVTQAGLTMKDIANSVHDVTAIMSEISAASVEQTSGIEQVNTAICQMDDATQQNAALVQQAAAAAELLEEQTQHLNNTVAHFKMNAGSSEEESSISIESATKAQKTIHVPVRYPVKPEPEPTGNGDWEMF
ncbi:MAG: methyl-accepting chemotaxis protein [Methylobacter sp.]|nr:methyl-accepting chemotaxis protein [Methylobacter sp.]